MLTKQVFEDLINRLNKGDNQAVISRSKKLLQHNAGVAGLHEVLGVAFARTNDLRNAIKHLKRATKIMPGLRSAHFNLAGVYLASDENREAVISLHTVLKLDPTNAEANHLLGKAFFKMKDFGKAREQFLTALKLNPQLFEPDFFLGQIARSSDDNELALFHFNRTLSKNPLHFEAQFNIGNIRRDNLQLEEAIAAFSKTLEMKPDHLPSRINRGAARIKLGFVEEGIEDLKVCLAKNPDHLLAKKKIAFAYLENHRLDEAMDMFEAILAQDPTDSIAEWNKFVILALQNKFKDAFPFAEARLDIIKLSPYRKSLDQYIPRWSGESLAGKHLFVHAEQGIGDTLMFMRFLQKIQEKAAKVTFAVQDPLVALIKAQIDPFEVICLPTKSKREKSFAGKPDLHCDLMSLPYFLGLETTQSFEVPGSYINVPATHLDIWSSRVEKSSGKRVGFVFQGNPTHKNDLNRSIPLEKFLTALPKGFQYHYLGVELGARERDLLKNRPDIRIHANDIADFCDTSALVSQMDVVISVDTSVAHLAGALGVETYILLPFYGDWRWGLEGSRSVWYDSVRLIRQPRPGDWDAVLEKTATIVQETTRPASNNS